jgi:hypothetical protein
LHDYRGSQHRGVVPHAALPSRPAVGVTGRRIAVDANIAIILDVYSHVSPGMDAQAANAMANLILDGSSQAERPRPKPRPSTDK